MKTFSGYPYIPIAIVMLVALFVLCAGCSSEPAGAPATPAAPVTGGGAGSISLPHGVGIAVPATWTREDVGTDSEKDYGTTTTTIARFTSPAAIPGDEASRNTLSVDFDPNPGGDFEVYFNQATLALDSTYDTGQPHAIVRSSTIAVSGYKSYELDFQTDEVKGSYIFTSTDKGMYIFAFKGENKEGAVRALQSVITDMVKSITITP
jgi:hypothetical protein